MVLNSTWSYLCDLIPKYIPEYILKNVPESIFVRTILIGTVTGIITQMVFKKRYKLPPGPFSFPLLGNLFIFSKEGIPQKLFELYRKYGPVFTISLGPQKTIVLNEIDDINEALLKKGAHFSDRVQMFTIREALHNEEDIIFGQFGSGWKLRRKLASRAIRLFMNTDNFNHKIEEAVSKTIEVILKEEGAFDPKPYLFYTTLNIIAAMCFGKSYSFDDPEYWALLTLLEKNSDVQSENLVLENVFPYFSGIYKTKRCREAEEIMNSFMSYVERHVTEHRAKFVPGEVHDLIDSLLQSEIELIEEGKDDMANFKPIHVTLIVFDVFLAGNDTSRSTLLWMLMFIVSTPGVQNKIHQEIDKVVGNDRHPTTKDRNKLSYLDAVLHESMRLGPVAPLGVPHSTSCDTTIGKYDVPKGTLIFINHYALHMNPDNWPEVNKFKPERYLDNDGKMAPKPDNWLPFSAGRRVCVGEPMAKPELHLVIAGLFQQLEFYPEPGTTIDTSYRSKGFVITPKPFKLVVKKRNK